jgi:N-acetyl-anhydromuramyl-L-alanine amidase AmpD
MLHLGANEVAKWARAYNIPMRKLSPTQVGADWQGICGHIDWTLGKHNGNHSDPGPFFPWDYFLSLVTGSPVTPPPPSGIPDMRYGERSDNVLRLQQFMTSKFQSYNKYAPTGYYGDATKAGIAEFQRRTGIVGGDGENVGPQTKVQLAKYGLVW